VIGLRDVGSIDAIGLDSFGHSDAKNEIESLVTMSNIILLITEVYGIDFILFFSTWFKKH
jgi:hypothetical protein